METNELKEEQENIEMVSIDEGQKSNDNNKNLPILKGDHSRHVDHTFGNVKSLNLNVAGSLSISSIATGSPVDGGTIHIPQTATIVIIQNVEPYTLLTFVLPKQPEYGQLLTISSTVDIANVKFSTSAFGGGAPSSMTANSPLRFIFAGSWFPI
jgi:hypothetical protein